MISYDLICDDWFGVYAILIINITVAEVDQICEAFV